MNTPTPRTDAAWAQTFDANGFLSGQGNAASQMRDECATLERELETEKTNRNHFLKKGATLERELAALAAERDELRAEQGHLHGRIGLFAKANFGINDNLPTDETFSQMSHALQMERTGLAVEEEKLRAERDKLLGYYHEIVAELGDDLALKRICAMKAEAERLTARCDKLDRENARMLDFSCVETLARAERAEAELAAERARLDYLSTRGFEHRHHETGDHLGYEWTISSYSESGDVTLRDVIDAEMREEAK